MSGGSPGSPGVGIAHARGICPECHRDVPGGVDHDTGRVILRSHKARNSTEWCSNRQRLTAMTQLDMAIRAIWNKLIPTAPPLSQGLLDYAREKFGPPPTTSCPACGSDDYMTELGDDYQPDYSRPKTCEECGETWT